MQEQAYKKPIEQNSLPEQKVPRVFDKKSKLLVILVVTLIIALCIGIYFWFFR